MKTLSLAGLAGFAAACAHAQVAPPAAARANDPVVVTATRNDQVPLPTLRDAVVITRAELDDAAPLTLAEVLQRHAGIEIRANGGPGQPAGLFVRGAGPAQLLVLVDGLRVASATTGATAIEAIPLELIERIEVVKGPMSGLYGSDAIGGVVQVFTRGKAVPHLFANAAYGSENDRRAAAGFATADAGTRVALSAGWRKVEARSASNPRASFGYDPDRDPHEAAYASLHAAQRMWNGEMLELEAFGSRSRTAYDGGSPADRSTQTLSGVKAASSTEMMPWWKMRLALGHTRDQQRSEGGFASLFETRQDQATFTNELRTATGGAVLGAEALRQVVVPASDGGVPTFSRDRRDTYSVFGSVNEAWQGQRLEANVRYDDDADYGSRSTGAVSYGYEAWRGILASVTVGRGFRVPSFNDLYLVQFAPYYLPNPDLRPERSRSTEVSVKSVGMQPVQWRVTAFDNRLTDLVTLTETSVTNLDRARIRGVELTGEVTWWGVRARERDRATAPRRGDRRAAAPARAALRHARPLARLGQRGRRARGGGQRRALRLQRRAARHAPARLRPRRRAAALEARAPMVARARRHEPPRSALRECAGVRCAAPRAAGERALRRLLAPTGRVQSPMVPDAINLSSVRRALVVKLRHHGDVLLASPVIGLLRERAPHVEVDALVYADTRDMLAGHPGLSRLHLVDRSWKRQGLLAQARHENALLAELRGRGYQLLVHLTEHWRGAWLAQALRPRWSVAPARDAAAWGWSFTHLYKLPRHTPRHTVEANLDALRRLGIYPEESDKRVVMEPGDEARARVDALLAAAGVPARGFIQVHPTSRWLFKAWTDAANAELLRRLVRDGHRVVITAAPDAREKSIVARILAEAAVPVTDLSGQLTLREMGALAARARLFCGVDSAPMHIAAAMGTPVVALFGPSGEKQWGPWGVAHRVVTTDHPCRPCGNDGCGGGKVSECLTRLPVDRVHAAVNELLALA